MHQSIFSWYSVGLPRLMQRIRVLINGFEAQLAIKATLTHLSEPLFQDYTLAGRIIGSLFRLGRIALGCILYLVIGLFGGLAIILWSLAPFLPAVATLGYFVGADQTVTTTELYLP
jgi:hypothetical protein